MPGLLGGPTVAGDAPPDMDWLLADVRARASVPNARTTGSDDLSIIRLLNDELLYFCQGLLAKVRKEHLVTVIDTPVVGGQASYPIPQRARGVKLRGIQLIATSGEPTTLKQLQLDEMDGLSSATGTPQWFHFEDTDVVLYPTPAQSSGTLRMPIYRRPSGLVQTASVGVISNINTGAKQVTVSVPPSSFASGAKYDLNQATPHFKMLAMDQTATLSGSTLTFTNALPSRLVVGDHVCLAGESTIPHLPLEMMAVLTQRTANTLRRNMNMKSDAGDATLKEMVGAVIELLSPRIEGQADTYRDFTFFGSVS